MAETETTQGESIPIAEPVEPAPQSPPTETPVEAQPGEAPAPADGAVEPGVAMERHAGSLAATAASGDGNAPDALQMLERRRKERRRKRLIHLGIVLGIVALLAIAAVAAGSMLGQRSSESAYAYEPVVIDTYQESVNAQGSTRPNTASVVTPEIEGIIEEVYVSEGQYVNEGDLLLSLSSASVDKVVAEAERAVATAEQNVNRAYDAAVRAFQADAENEADAATATGPTAQAELDSAYNELTECQAKLQDAQAEAAKKSVTAPAAGTITVMNAVKGAQVGGAEGALRTGNSSSSSELIQIADLSQMRVQVEVNEADVPKVQSGQEATITFPALPDLELTGTVEHIATVATGSEGGAAAGGGGATTYAVEIVIPEPDERIKPGMTASCEIVTAARPDSIMVPTNAVQMASDGTSYVLVSLDEEGTKTEERTVEVVTGSDGLSVVEGKLSAGELVAVPLGNLGVDGDTAPSESME